MISGKIFSQVTCSSIKTNLPLNKHICCHLINWLNLVRTPKYNHSKNICYNICCRTASALPSSACSSGRYIIYCKYPITIKIPRHSQKSHIQTILWRHINFFRPWSRPLASSLCPDAYSTDPAHWWSVLTNLAVHWRISYAIVCISPSFPIQPFQITAFIAWSNY